MLFCTYLYFSKFSIVSCFCCITDVFFFLSANSTKAKVINETAGVFFGQNAQSVGLEFVFPVPLLHFPVTVLSWGRADGDETAVRVQ